MPDALPLTGLYGKVPAHGDFVRRGLPSSFVGPWDAWLQAGVAAAREQLGAQWAGAWDSAPAWRFALPPGACGPDAVAGVMLPSQDQVGRRFPITLAALLPPGAPPPDPDWFDALEAAALAGLAGRADADALSAALPLPGAPIPASPFAMPPTMLAVASHQREAPAVPWPASDNATPLPEPADPPDDVLALLAIPAAPAPAGQDDDALALLIGASMAPAEMPPAMAAPDGTLAGLIGAASEPLPIHMPDPPVDPGLPLAGDDGTLAGLLGAPPAMAMSAPPPLEDDGILAGLIGAAPSAPAVDMSTPSPVEDDGILAGLIGAGADAPVAAAPEPTPVLALFGGDGGPPATEGPDLLPETVAMGWPDLADATDAAPDMVQPAEAPPAPAGGGWWTRGAAHVPPMVWPLAGLPPPADFAYLLEAAA